MYVERLEARSFRNLKPLALSLSPGTVVIRGANAQGKTNLLEALYVCATAKSFRNSPSRDLLCHHESSGRIAGVFSRHGVRHDVEVALNPRGRQVRIDGRGVRSAARLLQLVNVVAFFPDDLRIIKGSPEERRRFLDRSVANHRPELIDATLAYGKALKSRNALLRSPSQIDPRMLEVYEHQLVEYGAIIHACRVEAVARMLPLVRERFCTMMGADSELDLHVSGGLGSAEPPESNGSATQPTPSKPSLSTGGANGVETQGAASVLISDYSARFAEALRHGFSRDRARGLTQAGPHRADLNVSLNGQAARAFASQGQQRAIVLALKLAEVVYLRELLGVAPVLLLDDVSSELDTQRTAHFFGVVAELGSQVWITTTGAAPLPLPDDAQILEVEEGHIRELTPPTRKSPPAAALRGGLKDTGECIT